MKKLLFLLQLIIKCSFIFLLLFVWFKMLFSEIWLSIILSLALTITLEIFSYLISKKKNAAKTLKIKEKENADDMFLSLASSTNNIDFFYNLALTRHKNVIKKSEFIQIEHSDKSIVVLYPFLKFQNITQDDITDIYKKCQKANKIVILANDYDKSICSFIKNFKSEILLLNRYETYSLLYKEYDFYPEITLCYKKEIKNNFKDLFAIAFNKTKTKAYLFSALVLLIATFFVKNNLYYCIVSSLLVLFALISYINPRFNIQKARELL